MAEEAQGKDLEQGLLERLREFMLELGVTQLGLADCTLQSTAQPPSSAAIITEFMLELGVAQLGLADCTLQSTAQPPSSAAIITVEP